MSHKILLVEQSLQLPQAQAMALIHPHVDRLNECMEFGWQQWRGLIQREPEIAVAMGRRERANVVNALVRRRAAQIFDGVCDVLVKDDDGLALLVIANQVAVRLKLIGKDGEPHNIQTGRQRRLARQRHLAGMENWMVLVCGYRLNKDETEIEDVVIKYTCYGLRRWTESIRVERDAMLQLMRTRVAAEIGSVVEARRAKGGASG